jgi:hypothetical protein
LDVASICDPTVRFVVQYLACNFLRKCKKDQVPTSVIAATERCVEGVLMNWGEILLNQFWIDCEEAQDKGTEFHYSWILILIVLSSWRDMDDTQFLGFREKPSLVASYQSLWYTTNKAQHMENNIALHIYKETIRDSIDQTMCIPPQAVEAYKAVEHFKAGCHHMYVQEKKDPY